jgi:hypothetical protein
VGSAIGSPFPGELKSEKSNVSGIAKINQFTETVEEEIGETEDEKNMDANILQNKMRRLQGCRLLKTRSKIDTIDNDNVDNTDSDKN